MLMIEINILVDKKKVLWDNCFYKSKWCTIKDVE
jgi:hypothetical protein